MANSAPFIKLDEDRAIKVVLATIEDGLQRLRDLNAKLLLKRSGKLTTRDLAFLGEQEAALVRLATQVADKAVYGGKWGKLLTEAYTKGVKLGGRGLFSVDADTIYSALWPSRLLVKDLLAEGAQSISELTARAMGAGWSPSKLADMIEREVVLYDEGGSPYGVPRWRADLIAHEEPMKVLRAASGEDWTPDTLLEMVGPDDARTAGDICSEYLGEVKTLAQWQKVKVDNKGRTCDPQGHGMHPRCRHGWVEAEAA